MTHEGQPATGGQTIPQLEFNDVPPELRLLLAVSMLFLGGVLLSQGCGARASHGMSVARVQTSARRRERRNRGAQRLQDEGEEGEEGAEDDEEVQCGRRQGEEMTAQGGPEVREKQQASTEQLVTSFNSSAASVAASLLQSKGGRVGGNDLEQVELHASTSIPKPDDIVELD